MMLLRHLRFPLYWAENLHLWVRDRSVATRYPVGVPQGAWMRRPRSGRWVPAEQSTPAPDPYDYAYWFHNTVSQGDMHTYRHQTPGPEQLFRVARDAYGNYGRYDVTTEQVAGCSIRNATLWGEYQNVPVLPPRWRWEAVIIAGVMGSHVPYGPASRVTQYVIRDYRSDAYLSYVGDDLDTEDRRWKRFSGDAIRLSYPEALSLEPADAPDWELVGLAYHISLIPSVAGDIATYLETQSAEQAVQPTFAGLGSHRWIALDPVDPEQESKAAEE